MFITVSTTPAIGCLAVSTTPATNYRQSPAAEVATAADGVIGTAMSTGILRGPGDTDLRQKPEVENLVSDSL
jgi:hypothetical protein